MALIHKPLETWWPQFEGHERVSLRGWRFTYNLKGVRLRGEYRLIALERARYVLAQTTGGLEAAFEARLEPDGNDASWLTLRLDYAPPGALLGGIFNRASLGQQMEADLGEAFDRFCGAF